MNTKLIITQLENLLDPLGFTRQKKTWNRKIDPFVDVVNIQTSKAGNSFTVNAGVMYPDIYKICWGEDTSSFIDDASCTVRARIGELIDGKDLWWNDNEYIPDEIVENVHKYVLPFLNQMHSIEAMIERLANSNWVKGKYPYPPPVIYLGILKWKSGNIADARNILNNIRPRLDGVWAQGVDKVLKQLV